MMAYGSFPKVSKQGIPSSTLVISSLAFVWLLTACGPKISQIHPPVAKTGETVTIRGSQLTAAANDPKSVTFGGVAVPHADITRKGNDLEVVVPTGASSGLASVTTHYVGSSIPGGTASYPFTVVNSEFTEQEWNGAPVAANAAGTADRIEGVLATAAGDADWFAVSTGAGGSWANTLEIVVQATGVPTGATLRFTLYDGLGTPGTYLNYAWVDGSGRSNIWTTRAPGQNLYLQIHLVGTTPNPAPNISYTIDVARSPVTDVNEPDNVKASATALAGSSSVASFLSYLCSRYDGPTTWTGGRDWFSFPPNGSTAISAMVLDAGLQPPDGVYIEIFDNAGGYRGGMPGNSDFGIFDLQLSSGEKANGTWHLSIDESSYYMQPWGSGPAPRGCKLPYQLLVFF
jgi:hypothetical protein